MSGTTSPHTITDEIIRKIVSDRCQVSPAYMAATTPLQRKQIEAQVARQVEAEIERLTDNPQEAA